MPCTGAASACFLMVSFTLAARRRRSFYPALVLGRCDTKYEKPYGRLLPTPAAVAWSC